MTKSINIDAATLMGELCDRFLEIGYHTHKLEIYLVRLLFCLFADDTGIFNKNIFQEYIHLHTKEDGSDLAGHLSLIFHTLNQPEERREIKSWLKSGYMDGKDHITYLQLKRWAERRHPMKSKSWVKNRYWHTIIEEGENGLSIRNWVFKTNDGFELRRRAKIEIKRHIKVKGEASPYVDKWSGNWLFRIARYSVSLTGEYVNRKNLSNTPTP